MTFPVPPDSRADNDFTVVRGVNEMVRENLKLADESLPVSYGEWMKRVDSSGVTKAAKLAVGVDTLAAPALGAKVSWTKYVQDDSRNGQTDAMATGSVDLLGGSYHAKTKLYDTGGELGVGSLLVAIFDATQAGGILAGLPPGSATVRQLQAVVGRIVEVAGGVMHYEAPAS